VLARTVRTIEITEDIVHAMVWVLLVLVGILLVVDTARHVAAALTDVQDLQAIVILQETSCSSSTA
jgi:hypothetical protein